MTSDVKLMPKTGCAAMTIPKLPLLLKIAKTATVNVTKISRQKMSAKSTKRISAATTMMTSSPTTSTKFVLQLVATTKKISHPRLFREVNPYRLCSGFDRQVGGFFLTM